MPFYLAMILQVGSIFLIVIVMLDCGTVLINCKRLWGHCFVVYLHSSSFSRVAHRTEVVQIVFKAMVSGQVFKKDAGTGRYGNDFAMREAL